MPLITLTDLERRDHGIISHHTQGALDPPRYRFKTLGYQCPFPVPEDTVGKRNAEGKNNA